MLMEKTCGVFRNNRQKLAAHFVDLSDKAQERQWRGRDEAGLDNFHGFPPPLPQLYSAFKHPGTAMMKLLQL